MDSKTKEAEIQQNKIEEKKTKTKIKNYITKLDKKKISTLFICYSLAIFLLGFNINQNKNTINLLHESEDKNKTTTTIQEKPKMALALSNKNINCQVNSFNNIVKIICLNKIKLFSLGNNFNYTKCDFN